MKKGTRVRVINGFHKEAAYKNGDEAEYTGITIKFKFKNGGEYNLYPCEYEVINEEPTIADIMEELKKYGDGALIQFFGNGSGRIFSYYSGQEFNKFSEVIEGYNWLKEQNEGPTLTLSNGKKVSEKLVKELMDDYEKRNK